MKKTLSAILALLMLLSVFGAMPFSAFADDITYSGGASACFERLVIDGHTITDCTTSMKGKGWSVSNETIFLNNYNGSGINAKMNSNTTSVLQIVVVTDSTINDKMFGIYSNVGLRITGDGTDSGVKLNVNAGYVGINCSGLLEFNNGIYTVKCNNSGHAYAGIIQAHYLIEHTIISKNAKVFVDWKTAASNDIYGVNGFAFISGSNSTEANPYGEIGKLSVSVENNGSGNAYAHNIKDSTLNGLKSNATVYPSDSQHFFLNMMGVDRLDLTVDAPEAGNRPSKAVAIKQSGIGAELVGWIESGKSVFMGDSETYKVLTAYTPRFLINPSSFCEYYPDVAVTVNGRDAVFNAQQANNNQVISGIIFSTGSTEITSVSVLVTDPVACKAPSTEAICETPGCSVTGVYWYDKATNTQVSDYKKFLPERQYEVRVYIETSAGYELDTGGSFKTKINGNNAVVSKVYGNSMALIYYTYNTLPKVTLNNVTIEGTLVKGESLGGHLSYPDNMSVSAIQWCFNGEPVNEASTVTFGNYYATVTLVADSGFRFDGNPSVYAFGEECTDIGVMSSGTKIKFDTPTVSFIKHDGWVDKSDGKYYYKDGELVKDSLFKDCGFWYCTDANGKMFTGWKKYGTGMRYFKPDGIMATGLTKATNGNWYYFNSNGLRQYGWVQFGSNWRYFDKSTGVMAKGLTKIDSKWYFFNDSGIRQSGWVDFGTNKRYFGTDGVMYTDLKKIGSTWYYFDPSNGLMKTGWVKFGTGMRYFKPDGSMATGLTKATNGKWYYCNSNGIRQYGWVQFGSNWRYFDKSTGVMYASCTKKIDGKNYTFNSSGICTNK